jgi:AraC-like DNA-binding protein
VSPDQALDALKHHWVAAVLVDCDIPGSGAETLIRAIREGFPTLPVLVTCDLTADHMKRIPTLIRAGADELVVRGVDDVGRALRRVLLHATSARSASEMLVALRNVVPDAAEPILTYCVTHADRPLTVGKMARDLGVHRKTLCNRTAAAGLPTPSTLISWCRLIHAARLLDDPGRSVERAALLLGFGSGTALRNMLRRYTGLRPRELCKRGGHRALIGLLVERVLQQVSRLDAPRPMLR